MRIFTIGDAAATKEAFRAALPTAERQAAGLFA
jgi:hypothetical protein